jgi:hypothetical protein
MLPGVWLNNADIDITALDLTGRGAAPALPSLSRWIASRVNRSSLFADSEKSRLFYNSTGDCSSDE